MVPVIALGCASPDSRRTAALMEVPIVPSSDAIFGAVIYTNGRLASAPQTAADWERLAQHARRLESAAQELRALAPSDDAGQWTMQADALARASRETLAAIDAKNLDGVLTGGGKIYDTCTGCHAVYVKEN